MTRPPLPDTERWNEDLEAILKDHVRPRRSRRPTGLFFDRVRAGMRGFAEPIVHGVSALAAVLLVTTTLVYVTPEPATIADRSMPSASTDVAIAESAGSLTPTPADSDAPDYLTLLAPDDRRAVLSRPDIPDADGAFTKEPQNETSAVHTPDGGEATMVALRPTVE